MEEQFESILQELSIEQQEELKQQILNLLNAHSTQKTAFKLLVA